MAGRQRGRREAPAPSAVARVGADAERIERLREEAACGGGKDDVHDVRLREPEVAEPLQVGIVDGRGVVDDPLGEIHDRDVDLVEAGGAVIERDVADRLAEVLVQDRAVARQQ